MSGTHTVDEQGLAELRAAIDRVDAELLAALNRRAALSIEVGKLKAGSGAPVHRPDREAALLDKLTRGNDGPLPDEHLLAVYGEILASSRALQAARPGPFSPSGPSSPPSPEEDAGLSGFGAHVAVIGSRGRMGAALAERLFQVGYTVSGVDAADGNADVAAVLQHSRIVLLCVPVGALRGCLAELAGHLTESHLLMDITSVKTLPMRWMEEAFSGAVVGTHPMFGPAPRKEDMRVAMVRGNKASDADCAEAARLFACFGCEVFWTNAPEHDAGVAMSQSLNFTVSAVFLAALARHEGIRPYLTPSFKRHLESARKHLTQDAAMFLEFSAMNPEFPAAMRTFRNILDEALTGNLSGIAAEAAVWYQTDAQSK